MSTVDERFDAKVFQEPNSGCHLWGGAISPSASGKHPYGIFTFDGKLGMAHRFSYARKHGEIPDGSVIDHLCRNTMCVNPSHLEAVSPKENINRGINAQLVKTQCPKGHPYDGDNLYSKAGGKRRQNGSRECRQCRQENWRAWALRNGRNVRD